MFYATFNNVSVIYHTCGIDRGFRRLMFIATFNEVSVIYHTCAIGKGAQEAHVYCHFFNNVSVLLPHVLCCSQGIQKAHVLCHFQYSIIYHTFAVARGGSRGLCFMPLSILFQSFTTPVL
jgi:hypothetical protein